MSPKKLTDRDKQEILKLYRETTETTSTLAKRFGVTSSTISRFLKGQISELEYEELIQQKRLGRSSKPAKQLELEIPRPALAAPVRPGPETDEVNVGEEWEEELEEEEMPAVDVMALSEMLGEDLSDLADDDDLEEDEEEGDEEDWTEERKISSRPPLSPSLKIQVLPLSAATFPKTCYLVIDRASELIARPLKEFTDLGQIPAAEVQQKTLPVFDSHRVARRFSNRFQRVIKVPDASLLEKTAGYLHAKGITRLLLDGQVYSLSSP
jgi:transposase-like protein